MIVFKDSKRVYCILNNPKCGSSTLVKCIFNQINKKYKVLLKSGGTIKNTGYSDPRYNHCNLEAAVTWLKKHNINPKNVIFITTVRHPIERIKSNYFYYLSRRNVKKWKYNNRNKDINDFLDREHITHFRPKNFRYFQSYKTTEIVRLEHFKDDLNKLFKKYNLNISTKTIRVTNATPNKKKIVLSNTVRQRILEIYKLDIIDGKL